MTNLFTEREKTVLRLRSQRISNADIARQLDVTPVAISQMFKRISKKITSVNDSLQLMREIGVVEKTPKIQLTPKGLKEFTKMKESAIKIHKKPLAFDRIQKASFSPSGHTIANIPTRFFEKYKKIVIMPPLDIESWVHTNIELVHPKLVHIRLARTRSQLVDILALEELSPEIGLTA